LYSFNKVAELRTQALELDPTYADAWYYKAGIASLNNDINGSIDRLQKAIEFDNLFRRKAKEDYYFDNIRELPQFKERVGIIVYFSYSTVDRDLFKIDEIVERLTLFDGVEVIDMGRDLRPADSIINF